MTAVSHLRKNTITYVQPPALSPIKKILLIAGVIFAGLVLLGIVIYKKMQNSGQSSSGGYEDKRLINYKDFNTIKAAIAGGLNVNNPKYIECAFDRNDAIANLFAKEVKDVDTQIDDKPLLALAVKKGYDETACTLISRGAKTDIKTGYFKDLPLMFGAIDKNLEKTVGKLAQNATLRERKHKDKGRPIQYAVKKSKDEAAAALIRAGAKCDGNFASSYSFSKHSIHREVRERTYQCLPQTEQALVDMKVPMTSEDKLHFKDDNDHDWDSYSPEDKNRVLSEALEEKNFTLAATSIRNGANQDSSKTPALFVAIEADNDALFTACLENTQDLNKIHCSKTPLGCAMAKRRFDYARQLIEKGADAKTKVITRPIIFEAIDEEAKELVKACKDKGGADVTYTNRTPLNYALFRNKHEIAQDLYDPDNPEHTKMMLEKNKIELTRFVLSKKNFKDLESKQQVSCIKQLIKDDKNLANTTYSTLDEQSKTALLNAPEFTDCLTWMENTFPADIKLVTDKDRLLESALSSKKYNRAAGLIKNGARFKVKLYGQPVIFIAIEEGHEALFKACLAIPDVHTHVYKTYIDQYTPLQYALSKKQYDFALQLYNAATHKNHSAMLRDGNPACIETALKCQTFASPTYDTRDRVCALNSFMDAKQTKRVEALAAELDGLQKKAVFESEHLKPELCRHLVTNDIIPDDGRYTVAAKFVSLSMEDFEYFTKIMKKHKRPEESSAYGPYVHFVIDRNAPELLKEMIGQGYDLKGAPAYALKQKQFPCAEVLLNSPKKPTFYSDDVLACGNEEFITKYFNTICMEKNNSEIICHVLDKLLVKYPSIAQSQLAKLSPEKVASLLKSDALTVPVLNFLKRKEFKFTKDQIKTALEHQLGLFPIADKEAHRDLIKTLIEYRPDEEYVWYGRLSRNLLDYALCCDNQAVINYIVQDLNLRPENKISLTRQDYYIEALKGVTDNSKLTNHLIALKTHAPRLSEELKQTVLDIVKGRFTLSKELNAFFTVEPTQKT